MGKTSTGFKGISINRSTGRFEAKVNISYNSKYNRYYVGSFPTISKAVEARREFITNLL